MKRKIDDTPLEEIFATEDEIDFALFKGRYGMAPPEEQLKYDRNGNLQCRGNVHDGVGFHQCTRRATIEEGGYHWCKQHHPTTAKRRRVEKDRERAEEFNKKEAKREHNRNKQKAEKDIVEAAKACFYQKGSFDSLMEATERLLELENTLDN